FLSALGCRYSTARVSKRLGQQATACLRARRCAGISLRLKIENAKWRIENAVSPGRLQLRADLECIGVPINSHRRPVRKSRALLAIIFIQELVSGHLYQSEPLLPSCQMAHRLYWPMKAIGKEVSYGRPQSRS